MTLPISIRRAILLILLVLLLSACTPSAPLAVPAVTPTLPTLPDTLPPPTETLLPTSTPEIPTPTATELPTPTDIPLPTPTSLPDTPGIILFIGDGMGANHRLAAAWKASGKGGMLVMDSLPVHGLASTNAADQVVTDSAAAGTAISAGVLTNYGYVGVDPNGQAVTTILEYAQQSGWAVGLISTVQLSHATPAVFAAHDKDRDNMVGIARQMMAHKINVMLGGGENIFASSKDAGCYPGKGYQGNDLDMIADAAALGYTTTCSPEEFAALDLTNVDYLLGFFGGDEMPRPYQPSLADMTAAALEVLSHDPDGFFLMVEAGQIDWASHEDDAENTIVDTLGLDAAVVQGLKFT